jgi:penicillin-insensitive murein DD-endopeptidase
LSATAIWPASIVQLHKSAVKMNTDIWRVIFDPALQPYLFKTQHSEYLKQHIKFSTKKSWVRHDEHYHVDFLIACKPLDK